MLSVRARRLGRGGAPVLPALTSAPQCRAFRVTRPAQFVGPLVAGVGLAAALYGAKLLVQASRVRVSVRLAAL